MKLVLPGTAAADEVYRIMQAKGQGSKGTQL
jgi:3-hydroxyisobutyrate dehydrogenase